MSNFDYLIHSDGGGEKGSTAASACIVQNQKTGGEVKIVGFLGPGTNNEGEIFAGLLAFAFIRFAERASNAKIFWCSDSKYVLQSATEYILNWQRNGWKTASRKPVKNQGLWNMYLNLSDGYQIEVEHVKGHSGQLENEGCDSASTWARNNAISFLANNVEGSAVNMGNLGIDQDWGVLDLREIIKSLRNELSVDSSMKGLEEKIINLSATKSQALV